MQFDHSLQIAIVGQPQVGKTTIFNILTQQRDDSQQETAYSYFRQVYFQDFGNPLKILLWDVANSTSAPDFGTNKRGRMEALLKFVNACIIVYDATSFDALKDIYEVCKRFNWLPDKTMLPVLFVGTKNDLSGAKDWREKILKMGGGYKSCIFVNQTNEAEIKRAFAELVEKAVECVKSAASKYLVEGIEK